MYESIAVKNFKRFKKLEKLELAPITFFVGPNNSGKSTVVQALRILNEVVSRGSLVDIDFSDSETRSLRNVDASSYLCKAVQENSFELSFERDGASFTYKFTPVESLPKLSINRIDILLGNYRLKIIVNGSQLNCELTLIRNEDILVSKESKEKIDELIEKKSKELQALTSERMPERSKNKDRLKKILKNYSANRPKISAVIRKAKFHNKELRNKLLGQLLDMQDLLLAVSSSFKSGDQKQVDLLDDARDNLEYWRDIYEYLGDDIYPEEEIGSTEWEDKEIRQKHQSDIKEVDRVKKYIDKLAEEIHKMYSDSVDDMNGQHVMPAIMNIRSELNMLRQYKAHIDSDFITIEGNVLDESIDLDVAANEEFVERGVTLDIDLRDSNIEITDTTSVWNLMVNQPFLWANELIPENDESPSRPDMMNPVGSLHYGIVSKAKYYYIPIQEEDGRTKYFNVSLKGGSFTEIIRALKRNRHSVVEMNEWNLAFLERWVKEFEIGSSLDIKNVEGPIYRILVNGVDGDKDAEQDISDVGRGSRQLLYLMLSLICAYQKNELTLERDALSVAIVIEEPEMNLHPRVQAMVLEMIYEFAKQYDFQVIIETHSEYMLRKSQLMHVEQQGQGNDKEFSCVYFDKGKEGPYNMEYEKDGKFRREFGTGFFDTGVDLSVELWRRNN